ncbi:hypothetical protein PIB30_070339 [Stylosanthes scabra]|uniref:Aminotransferase-like plant mobile domain-containing protein n=1 Tax=Stylosanthes scabra TaxID=79078 RepID=A0ABU6WLS0_9FABA|nr:hypothetical protein [Stylosanthes scabra]
MERGQQELRVAANRASIGALDQKLSRPEVGVSGGRIDSEPVLYQFSTSSHSLNSHKKERKWLKWCEPFLLYSLKGGVLVISWFGPFRAKLSAKVYYPRFVVAAFASVAVDDNLHGEGQGSFHFCVSFMGQTFKFPLERIVAAWGLRNAGTTFRGGRNPHSEWNEFEKMDAARALRLSPASSGKYHISRMATTHRLLLYAISYMLMPRKGNHGTATEEDLILLWAMINEKQVNWPYLMAHKLVDYSHGKINSALGLPHLWTKVFPLIPLDVSQEEFVASRSNFVITSKNINQMRRDLAHPDAGEGDVPERNVRPRADVGSSSQAPREAGETSQSQPNYMEILLKSFKALQARVDDGFAKLTDRIDSIDISLISQAEEMRMLRDRFLESVGEVPPTAEPTAEAPTEIAPTVEVPTTDLPLTDEVTRTDDPAAEGVTEVAPAVADQGEGIQAAMETTEVVQVVVSSVEGVQVVADSVETAQEQSVETPAQD